jgi:site-specific recombinase XerD
MELKDAIAKFIKHLEEAGRSPYTVLAYAKDLEQLLEGIGNMKVTEIKTEELKAYLEGLQKKNKFTAKTISRKLNSTRSLFGFLKNQGIIKEDPSNTIAHPEIKSRKARYLSETEYRGLRDAARDNAKLYTLIELMLQTGLRISEVSLLKLEDLQLQSHPAQILIREYGSNAMRLVELNDKAKQVLEDYLPQRQEPAKDQGFVFNTKNGGNMIVRNIRSAVNRLLENAGIEQATVNDLRNTFIVKQLEAGVSLAKVAQLVGHKRFSSTEKYLELTDRKEPGKSEKLAVL